MVWRLEVANGIAEETQDPIDLVRFAYDTGLTSYDSAYVLLARQLDLPLATRDGAVMRVARAQDVTVLSPASSI